MRALIFTHAPADQLGIPVFAEEQIIAGPDWPDAQDRDGRWLSLRTPVGDFELEPILAKIPDGQHPDLIVCLCDREAAERIAGLETATIQGSSFSPFRQVAYGPRQTVQLPKAACA